MHARVLRCTHKQACRNTKWCAQGAVTDEIARGDGLGKLLLPAKQDKHDAFVLAVFLAVGDAELGVKAVVDEDGDFSLEFELVGGDTVGFAPLALALCAVRPAMVLRSACALHFITSCIRVSCLRMMITIPKARLSRHDCVPAFPLHVNTVVRENV